MKRNLIIGAIALATTFGIATIAFFSFSFISPRGFIGVAQKIRPAMASEFADNYPYRTISDVDGKPSISMPCQIIEDANGYTVQYMDGFYMKGKGKLADSSGAFKTRKLTPSHEEQTQAFEKLFASWRAQVFHPWRKEEIIREATERSEAVNKQLLARLKEN